MTHRFSAEQLEIFRTSFKKYDVEGFAIPVANYRTVLTSMVGCCTSEDTVKADLASHGLDAADESAKLNFDQFLDLMAKKITENHDETSGQFMKACVFLDEDKTGFVHVAAMREILKSGIDDCLNDEDVEEALAEASKLITKEGKIDYKEFHKLMFLAC